MGLVNLIKDLIMKKKVWRLIIDLIEIIQNQELRCKEHVYVGIIVN
jgi:hypothetical protein